jgi:3-methylcrotonyl-CoA carboxylase alpha subunit
MKRYVVRHGDRTLEVTLAERGNGYRITLDGRDHDVDLHVSDGSPARSLLLNGRSFETATMPSRDGLDVFVSGDVFRVQVTDELWARAQNAAQAGDRGHEEVLSPMPGAVVRVAVEPGEVVEAGATVAVLEAMKMQNDIAAVRGGRVEAIRVKAGDVVDQNAVLVVLGPVEPR